MIGYHIFEQFYGGVISCLYKEGMNNLLEEGIVDDYIFEKTQILRTKFMAVIDTDELWNVEAVKTSKEWLEILDLSDEIKDLIKNKWSEEEIKYLLSLDRVL